METSHYSLKTFITIIQLVLGAWVSANAQSSFQNLGFESATIPALNPPDQPITISIGQALPAWSGFLGTNAASQVFYNEISAGAAAIALVGLNTDIWSNNVIAGNYTVVLQAGNAGIQVPAAIAQTGFIPTDSLSVRFGLSGNIGGLEVTFGGENIPIVPLEAFSNYELYGGDISSFAGQSGELRFTENPTAISPFGTVFIDQISFSVDPVPEPGTWSLLVCGAILGGVKVFL